MRTGLALQYVVVALAAAASLAYVVRTRFPGTWRRMRGWLAIRLVGHGSPAMAKLGRRIAPAPRAQDGCGSCDGCDPKR